MTYLSMQLVVPSTGQTAEIELDDGMTSAEVIGALIENNIVPHRANSSTLRLRRTGAFLAETSTLQQGGLMDNDIVAIES